jgi:hypothetical protein
MFIGFNLVAVHVLKPNVIQRDIRVMYFIGVSSSLFEIGEYSKENGDIRPGME